MSIRTIYKDCVDEEGSRALFEGHLQLKNGTYQFVTEEVPRMLKTASQKTEQGLGYTVGKY